MDLHITRPHCLFLTKSECSLNLHLQCSPKGLPIDPETGILSTRRLNFLITLILYNFSRIVLTRSHITIRVVWLSCSVDFINLQISKSYCCWFLSHVNTSWVRTKEPLLLEIPTMVRQGTQSFYPINKVLWLIRGKLSCYPH